MHGAFSCDILHRVLAYKWLLLLLSCPTLCEIGFAWSSKKIEGMEARSKLPEQASTSRKMHEQASQVSHGAGNV